jgi:hypothetical protein
MRERRPRGPLPLLYPPFKGGGYKLVHHEFCTCPVPSGGAASRAKGESIRRLGAAYPPSQPISRRTGAGSEAEEQPWLMFA